MARARSCRVTAKCDCSPAECHPALGDAGSEGEVLARRAGRDPQPSRGGRLRSAAAASRAYPNRSRAPGRCDGSGHRQRWWTARPGAGARLRHLQVSDATLETDVVHRPAPATSGALAGPAVPRLPRARSAQAAPPSCAWHGSRAVSDEEIHSDGA